MEWKIKATQLHKEKAEWSKIYEVIINDYFPNIQNDKERTKVKDRIRSFIRRLPEYEAKHEAKQEVVGIIPDTHMPFCHPNFIHFLEDTFKEHRVTKIVHIGDLCDNHAISRHPTETDASDPNTEYELAMKNVEIYTRAFPKVSLCLGNHDLIPQRQAASLGIPCQFVKSMKELWNLPKGWEVDEQYIINNVKYEHGINWGGKTGALNKAVAQMQSCVIGHYHSQGGCQYSSNAKSIVFGLATGCGVDIDRYAFRYGKYNKNREVMGCGIVFSDSNALFVPMDDRYFRGK